MKIKKMWAMFNKNDMLYSFAICQTRKETIEIVEKTYASDWRCYYRRGYRIGKVAVVKFEDLEKLMYPNERTEEK